MATRNRRRLTKPKNKQELPSSRAKIKNAPFKLQLEVSENFAFLLLKDWKTVLFNMSALNVKMPYDVIKGTDPVAKKFVYGLSPLKCWTDDSMGMRNAFMAPWLVVEYNLHMSAVNRGDHA